MNNDTKICKYYTILGEFGIVYKAILTKGPAGLQTRSSVAVKTLKGMYKNGNINTCY